MLAHLCRRMQSGTAGALQAPSGLGEVALVIDAFCLDRIRDDLNARPLQLEPLTICETSFGFLDIYHALLSSFLLVLVQFEVNHELEVMGASGGLR